MFWFVYSFIVLFFFIGKRFAIDLFCDHKHFRFLFLLIFGCIWLEFEIFFFLKIKLFSQNQISLFNPLFNDSTFNFFFQVKFSINSFLQWRLQVRRNLATNSSSSSHLNNWTRANKPTITYLISFLKTRTYHRCHSWIHLTFITKWLLVWRLHSDISTRTGCLHQLTAQVLS